MDSKFIKDALLGAFVKLKFKEQIKNIIMFIVYIVSIITTVIYILSFFIDIAEDKTFMLVIAIFLWATVIFANFAESIAESRGKASAEFLKKGKKDTDARVVETVNLNSKYVIKKSSELQKGEYVLVKANEQIPLDGEVVEGVASVDESAITGESAPVIREAGGDRNSVTGGTTVLSDWIIIKVTAVHGESFLDKMIEMIEGSKRKKTPNEVALEILLLSLTAIFIIVTISLFVYQIYIINMNKIDTTISIISLMALLVCLIPTTIGALLSSIGIAGMTRLNKKNILATSGRAIEAAGDVDILLLDKTGTITLGNRRADKFIPLSGIEEVELAEKAVLASIADETAEGRSIVVLAKNQFNIRANNINEMNAKFIDFSATTKMSGIDIDGVMIRKGAKKSIKKFVEEYGIVFAEECEQIVEDTANKGATPLVVASNEKIYGVIVLKDILKENIKEKFAEMRKMGIKTIMITGDNELTAKAISFEAGVDDFLAEATPEAKMKLIKNYQKQGHLVAMTGDGTNDAPALAAADVAVAMNSGTTAAKEAGNMIDLDSNPTKLIEVVKVGKQLLMTRGALTTFSIANDVAKYFAVIPALFTSIYPSLDKFNIMNLTSPNSAILSAIIFNCIIIVFLIPIAIKGVRYKEVNSKELLKRNLTIYGLGGLITPFIGIKLIDIFIGGFFV